MKMNSKVLQEIAADSLRVVTKRPLTVYFVMPVGTGEC
jgi:hypothetical protein